MTDVATVQAFREFDARVAERVMGWKNCRPNHSFDLPISGIGFGVGDPPEGWEGHLSTQWRRYMIPPFTTDDGAAMLILDELRRRHGTVRLQGSVAPDFAGEKIGPWFCFIGEKASAHAPTIALAICRAALEAVRGPS